LPAGVTTFQATHTYQDDSPTGTSSDVAAIFVTVTNINSGAFGVGSTTVKVDNISPTIQSLSPPGSINENDTLTLTGAFYDPGTLDTHTVVINWGQTEGTTTITKSGAN